MMRKNPIFKTMCALFSVLMIGTSVGCSFLNKGEESSSGANSVATSEETTSQSSEAPETPSESEDPETSETPETSESDSSSEADPQPQQNSLTITAPTGEVFPYIDCVKEYLQAGAGAEVSDYYETVRSQYAPVQVKWKYNATGVRKFLVEYATKADFSDALSVEAGATKRSADIYNLYKGTTYYVRITAFNSKGETLHTAESEFTTTDLGPRFMMIDDVHNVRDLGGYTTASGKTLAQGIAYRGGALTIPPNNVHYHNEISEDGKKYMSEVMGIKSEIDFRTEQESGVTLAEGSVIPNATLTYITLNGYQDTFAYDDEYYAFFSMLADKNNYPVYMHCTGGADRTGSVVFLLHTMLGVSELECVQGYELTSFSTYGVRDTQSGTYMNYFQAFMTKLNTYAGNTMQEKVETWVRSIGVTQAQIDSIKAIFYGEVEIEGKTFLHNAGNQTFNLPVVGKKTLNQQYTESLAAWTVQNKKNKW